MWRKIATYPIVRLLNAYPFYNQCTYIVWSMSTQYIANSSKYTQRLPIHDYKYLHNVNRTYAECLGRRRYPRIWTLDSGVHIGSIRTGRRWCCWACTCARPTCEGFGSGQTNEWENNTKCIGLGGTLADGTPMSQLVNHLNQVVWVHTKLKYKTFIFVDRST